MQPVAAVMNGLKGGVRRLRAALRERVLTLGGRRVFFDPAAFIGDRWPHWRAGGWRDLTVVPLLTAPRTHTEVCAHYPTALCFEMTARCNLTCVHCSSHGAPEVHRTNNKIAEIPLAQLEALASEVFPSLTVISLVGRGEPLLLDEAL